MRITTKLRINAYLFVIVAIYMAATEVQMRYADDIRVLFSGIAIP